MKGEPDIAEVSTKDLVQGIRACSRFLKSEPDRKPGDGQCVSSFGPSDTTSRKSSS